MLNDVIGIPVPSSGSDSETEDRDFLIEGNLDQSLWRSKVPLSEMNGGVPPAGCPAHGLEGIDTSVTVHNTAAMCPHAAYQGCGEDGVPDDKVLEYQFNTLSRALFEVPTALFGGRSLMMMVAHPEVAIAVERHSTYHESPFIRMWDTLCLAAALVQGTVSDRQLSLKYIGAKHGAIKGFNEEYGCPYSAQNKEAQLYVWGCLVENIDFAYELLLNKPSQDFQDALYRDWKLWARQFGIPRRLIPPNRDAFHQYMAAEIASKQPLHPESKEILRKMYTIGSSPGRLSWWALPLYPMLAFYRRFNEAALMCAPTTRNMHAEIISLGISGSASTHPTATTLDASPASSNTTNTGQASLSKLPAIVKLVRVLWGLMPWILRWLTGRIQRILMLPLATRFRKSRLVAGITEKVANH